MRILIVSESYYPVVSGVAVTVERLCNQLTANGHEVSLVTASQTGRQEIEKRDGYAVYYSKSRPNPFRPGLYFSRPTRKWLQEVIKEVNPELVHLHDPATLSQSIRNLATCPVVITQHFNVENIVVYLPKIWLVQWVARTFIRLRLTHLYNSCAVVTVPTQTVKDTLQPLNLRVAVEVISNGVDVHRFSIAETDKAIWSSYGVNPKSTILLYIGRIDLEKNLDTLIAALPFLQSKDWHMVMVGDGKSRKFLQGEVKKLALEDQVTWIDPVLSTSTLLANLYAAADIFCMPSALETESMVTLEAMAAGLPVIASNSGALPELVKDKENGLLVEPTSPNNWALAIDELVGDPEQRKRYGEMSKVRVSARDVAVTGEQMLALYQRLITEKETSNRRA
jgi:glycosyltransferase involved in cell wall biosynthesis